MAKKTVFQDIDPGTVSYFNIDDERSYGIWINSMCKEIGTVLGTESEIIYDKIKDILKDETTNDLTLVKKAFVLPLCNVSADRIKTALKEHKIIVTNDYEQADCIVTHNNYDEHFYVCPSPYSDYIDAPEYGQAYGAAYLCHRDFFNRVKFIDARFEIMIDGQSHFVEFQPTETTAGHDLLRTENAICLKSRDFFYFHVDHLSGYEFNKTLGNA